MKVEAALPLRVKVNGEVINLSPGQVIDLRMDRVHRLLAKVACQIWWKSPGVSRVQGPAAVDCVHVTEEGEVWVFIIEAAGWRAIAATSIEKIVLVQPKKRPSWKSVSV